MLRVLSSHKIGLGLISLPGVTFGCNLFPFLLRIPIDFILGSVVFVVPPFPPPPPHLLLTNWASFNAWFQASGFFLAVSRYTVAQAIINSISLNKMYL